MKFIVIAVLSFLITKFLNFSYNMFFHGSAEVKEVVYHVTAKEGIVGCLSKEKFAEALSYYNAGNSDEVKKMINDKVCFLFKLGEQLKASEGTCSNNDDDNDLFPFSSDQILLVKPYIPCFAVR